MKTTVPLFAALAWRLKFRWQCCGGHYIDATGANRTPYVAYRFVFCHKLTHEVRYEERPLAHGQLEFNCWRVLGEAVAIGLILATFVVLWLIT